MVYRLITDAGDDTELHIVRLEPYDDGGVEKERYIDFDEGSKSVEARVYGQSESGWTPTNRVWYQTHDLALSKKSFPHVIDLINTFTRTTDSYEMVAQEPVYEGEPVLSDAERDEIIARWNRFGPVLVIAVCFVLVMVAAYFIIG